eukprot:5759961-Amphidinium_carterae.2
MAYHQLAWTRVTVPYKLSYADAMVYLSGAHLDILATAFSYVVPDTGCASLDHKEFMSKEYTNNSKEQEDYAHKTDCLSLGTPSNVSPQQSLELNTAVAITPCTCQAGEVGGGIPQLEGMTAFTASLHVNLPYLPSQ